MLSFTRALIAVRRQSPALVRGDYTPLAVPAGTLAYLRSTPGQRVLAAMNFTRRKAVVHLEQARELGRVLLSSRPGRPSGTSPAVELAPGEVLLAELSPD